MENEVKSNIPPTQPVPQAPVSPSTNWQKILLFTTLGLIVVTGSIFVGIQIGKNQISNQELITEKPTPPAVQTEVSPTSLPATPNPTINPNLEWKTYSNEKYGFKVKYHPASTPNELEGNNEVGQFTYLFLVKFGTNPIKSPFGYELRIAQMTPDYRGEIVGHITDKIDSEEEILINNNTWKKFNYQIFLTTDYVRMSMATINHGGYSYAITSSSLDTVQILSTFEFTN